jgi:putative aldouronate transport system substrate-binding protein
MTQNFSDKNAKLGHTTLYPEKKFANRTALANMICINKNSKNPERVLMFMNLLETDQKLYDMVLYGIEGKTYEVKDGQAVLPAGEDPANPSYMNFG